MSAALAGPMRAVGSRKSEVSGSSDSSAAESFPISVSFHLSYVVDAWLIYRGLYWVERTWFWRIERTIYVKRTCRSSVRMTRMNKRTEVAWAQWLGPGRGLVWQVQSESRCWWSLGTSGTALFSTLFFPLGEHIQLPSGSIRNSFWGGLKCDMPIRRPNRVRHASLELGGEMGWRYKYRSHWHMEVF